MTRALVAFLLIVGAGCVPVAPNTTQPTERWVIEMMTAVNGERADAGAPIIRLCQRLHVIAQGHSVDQAQHRRMSHTGSDGSRVWDRADAVGYDWRSIGENVAYGYPDVDAVMAGWMSSDEGHAEAIVDPRYEHIGLGLAFNRGVPYWTQVFGRGGEC